MSISPPIQRESPQEVCLLCDLTILCLFSRKIAATFAQELALFCPPSVWHLFWHVDSSTNTKREFSKKDCILCNSTLLFVFKKKVYILWARTGDRVLAKCIITDYLDCCMRDEVHRCASSKLPQKTYGAQVEASLVSQARL